MSQFFHIEKLENVDVLRLASEDGTNRLKRACVLALTDALRGTFAIDAAVDHHWK